MTGVARDEGRRSNKRIRCMRGRQAVLRTSMPDGVTGRSMTGIRQILSQIEDGDCSAAGPLLPLDFDELRKLADARLLL